MKKYNKVKNTFILFCFLILISHIKIIQVADAQFIYVDISYDSTKDGFNSGYFNNIQYAIENASSGNILYVHNGTYNESIKIDKSIQLIGENRNKTIIEGKTKNITISVTAENVTIENLTIQNSWDKTENFGVVINSDFNHIKNNVIMNCDRGIILQNCKNNSIHNNIISNAIYGIGLRRSTKNIISENYVSNSKITGISLTDGQDNKIKNNTVLTNNFGIALSFENNSILDNNFINNNRNSGFNIYSCNKIFLYSNFLKNNSYGIFLYSNDKNITIVNNLIVKGKVGIYLPANLQNYKIYNNMFSDVNEAIHFEKKTTIEMNPPILIISIISLLISCDIIILCYFWKKRD
ncbi:MAG: right-handed parallel beta-helix repeat-containing protein [Thermoplasmatales archaeon]|nr:right-handed parallel beta-helix repeat-containing protein [Thermoplasmatales archaeon]